MFRSQVRISVILTLVLVRSSYLLPIRKPKKGLWIVVFEDCILLWSNLVFFYQGVALKKLVKKLSSMYCSVKDFQRSWVAKFIFRLVSIQTSLGFFLPTALSLFGSYNVLYSGLKIKTIFGKWKMIPWFSFHLTWVYLLILGSKEWFQWSGKQFSSNRYMLVRIKATVEIQITS